MFVQTGLPNLKGVRQPTSCLPEGAARRHAFTLDATLIVSWESLAITAKALAFKLLRKAQKEPFLTSMFCCSSEISSQAMVQKFQQCRPTEVRNLAVS